MKGERESAPAGGPRRGDEETVYSIGNMISDFLSRNNPPGRFPKQTHMRRIYLATVIDQYESPGYANVLEAVKAFFGPSAKILEARSLWNSNDEWRAGWPRLLPTVDALAVWPRPDRTLGAGLFREIEDARKHRVPVFIFASADEAPFSRFAMVPLVPAVGRPNLRIFGMIQPRTPRAKTRAKSSFRPVARVELSPGVAVGGERDGS